LNAGAAGSETMKNLVLGGIASFTVVDAQLVEASDLGSNFLVDAASLGATRAATVCGLLQELNPSVTGSFVEERPETLIEGNPTFFNGFTLVIATQLPEQVKATW
jgi:amyloid beta precursor protein binding protein 1